MLTVKTIVGAEAAYACISTESVSLDVRLAPGKSAFKSLKESAAEMREQAERLIKRAELIEQAAALLV